MRSPLIPQQHRLPGAPAPVKALLGATFALALAGTIPGTLAAPVPPKAKPQAVAATPIVWTDLEGRGYTPLFLRAHPATVFLFVSTECPLANAYLPRIQELEARYYQRGVRVFLVDAHPADTLPRLQEYVKSRQLVIPVVKDPEAVLTARLGATRTPEAVVVGREGQVLYRGRIDDHKDPKLVRKQHLVQTLDAILEGRPVPSARTEVEGCFISRPRPVPTSTNPTVTYSRHIAPILHRHCATCHRPGEVAPFSLLTYEDARTWSQTIKDVTQRRIMPPWKPLAGHGDFHDARAMTPEETSLLARWAESGAPAGNLKEAPPAPKFAEGWTLGQPDVLIQPEQEYRLTRKVDEGDEYRCFVLPAEFKEDTYVTASQIKAGNRAIVHHIIVYVDPTGKAAELDAKDPEPGFRNPLAGLGSPVPGSTWLAGWAPGNTPRFAPPGVAVKVPKGARLVMEVHYHPSGQVETDR
ncbi:MAG: Peroxiredoxin, partial [Armatimonadetes bacterium]|nr:Peroxiredoxin [Armatimonadota bacterium]